MSNNYLKINRITMKPAVGFKSYQIFDHPVTKLYFTMKGLPPPPLGLELSRKE